MGVDGLLRRSGNAIVGVTNYLTNGAEDTRIELRSKDGWHTARLTVVRPAVDTLPTAVTAGPGGSVYQLSGRIDLYFSGTDYDAFVLRGW